MKTGYFRRAGTLPYPIRPLLSGISTFLPGTRFLRSQRTGGSDSARYCYTVWMRHLLVAHANGLIPPVPKVVAEVGPGDSIGIGLAAILSGADKYFGLDVVDYASAENNLKVFEELVALFRDRETIPGGAEFPLVRPDIEDVRFPDHILTDRHLAACLDSGRLDALRESVENTRREGSMVRYVAPWQGSEVVRPGSLDMAISQSVLQYVADPLDAYRTLHGWIRPGGFMSHTIDFKWDGAPADLWNLHWTYSDAIWRLFRGRHAAYHTRVPYSTHRQWIEEAGFRLVHESVEEEPTGVRPKQLSRRFRRMTEKDLHARGAFLQAGKPC